jgi:hypothetical protein
MTVTGVGEGDGAELGVGDAVGVAVGAGVGVATAYDWAIQFPPVGAKLVV